MNETLGSTIGLGSWRCLYCNIITRKAGIKGKIPYRDERGRGYGSEFMAQCPKKVMQGYELRRAALQKRENVRTQGFMRPLLSVVHGRNVPNIYEVAEGNLDEAKLSLVKGWHTYEGLRNRM